MTNDTVLKVGIIAKTKGLKYLSVPVNFSVSFSTVNSSIKLERLSNFQCWKKKTNLTVTWPTCKYLCSFHSKKIPIPSCNHKLLSSHSTNKGKPRSFITLCYTPNSPETRTVLFSISLMTIFKVQSCYNGKEVHAF